MANSHIPMDPLSIATVCITLIAAVESCGRYITNFAENCRDADQNLNAIFHELSDLDMTLHILKDDTEKNGPSQLPVGLRQYVCDIIENCNGVLVELKALLSMHDGVGLQGSTGRALSGRKDAEKIRSSLQAHRGALSLVAEATTLHMTTAVATNVRKISNDTSLIKEYTMKIVEQLAKQDDILEQIAWIRAVVSQRSDGDYERTLVMDKYLDSMSDYAGSVYGDSVPDDIAEGMHQLSLEGATNLLNQSKPSPFLSDDAPDSMTIVIGNTHRQVEPQPYSLANKHLWSFYLQASGEEIIHEVIIKLHPTFMPRALNLRSPPYKVTRIGWGYFTVDATIVLKPGYLWHREYSKSLKLEWQLDFDGFGSSASYDYAVIVE